MKKYGSYIALFVVFFVVFLGMRNPWLEETPGPKRKGRAAVSYNTFSKSLSLTFDNSCQDHDHSTPIALALAPLVAATTSLSISLPLISEQITPARRYLITRSSRAPPSSLS